MFFSRRDPGDIAETEAGPWRAGQISSKEPGLRGLPGGPLKPQWVPAVRVAALVIR